MWRLLAVVLFVALAVGGWWAFRRPSAAEHADPVDVAAEPTQEALEAPIAERVERGGRAFSIDKLYRYAIGGEVVSATAYDLTWTNDFFDVDVGLVWGPRLDDLKERYKFSQSGRWLFWRSPGPVSDVEREYVTAHCANQHLIPAEGHRNLAKAIRWIRAGNHVKLSGYLVRIRDDSGRTVAMSSTSRHDTGDGACEIVWVDEVQIGDAVYR